MVGGGRGHEERIGVMWGMWEGDLPDLCCIL